MQGAPKDSLPAQSAVTQQDGGNEIRDRQVLIASPTGLGFRVSERVAEKRKELR